MTATDKSQLWDAWAASYDSFHGPLDAGAAAAYLSHLPGSRYLELGVGTGRVALELAGRGCTVTGIDISPAMIEALGEKARSSRRDVHARVGDMRSFDIADRVDCVYIAYSGLYELESADAQLQCLQSCHRALCDGGALVIEGYVPSVGLMRPSQTLSLRSIEQRGVSFVATTLDLATQRIEMMEVSMDAAGSSFLPVRQRFIWASELNLMARIANFAPVSLHADYEDRPFTGSSARYVARFQRVE